MKRFAVLGLVITVAFAALRMARADVPRTSESPRVVRSLDSDWRFQKADAPGAEAAGFNDASWNRVNVPHDWSIAGPFDQANPAGGAGAFLPTGVAFYRKHFTLPATDSHKRVFVEFGGVMANSDVWINGFHLGKRPNGYVSFQYELTDHLSFGNTANNVLAVRADTAAQPASRWYAGSGIYRHVRLIITDLIHLENWATFVSTPQIDAGKAVVHVQTAVVNESPKLRKIQVRVNLVGPDGKPAGSAETEAAPVAPGKTATFQRDVTVTGPKLWNLDAPALYRAEITVLDGASTLDQDVTSFGIRDARFDAATGFWLNGKNIKLKGVCLHQDGGAFGVAVPDAMWIRRLGAFRAIGVNAIRTAHNPPSPEFLTLCDKMGFLVMDEMFDCWTVAKNRYDYHLYFNEWSQIDTRDTVRRDRNHPSVILYSAGNEIHDTPDAEKSKRILGSLVAVFHTEDPTRPVTQALFRPNSSHDYDNGLADMLDVVGTNYRDAELLSAHAARPARKIVGTENGQSLPQWRVVRDNACYSGQFLWVGIDYLGESRRWPVIGGGGDQSGLLDRTGAPKPVAFQRQSWWSEKPMVRIARRVAPEGPSLTDPGYGNTPIRRTATVLCDWTPANSAPLHLESVEVYSNAQNVDLQLNGKSLGSKAVDPDGAPTTWKVPFEPGVLRAVASTGGKTVAEDQLRTAGKPATIVLTLDSSGLGASWDEASCVTATIVDAAGIVVPDAADLISFKADGPAEIVAVDNADNASHEPFEASARHVYHGNCVAYVRLTALSRPVVITASAPGLLSGAATIAGGTVFASPGTVEPGSKTK